MSHQVSSAWIDELTANRYKPMLRLLDEGEFDFLQQYPGVTPRQIAALRSTRCRIFRGYLGCLAVDFDRVCMTLKLLIAESQQDRPDLARVLLKQQARFAVSMTRVRIRLLLYGWGLSSVDVSGPLRVFDGVRLQLAAVAPVAV